MTSQMELTANIKEIVFRPHDFIEIRGMVWSRYRESRCVNDTNNRYTERWFWSSHHLPEIVSDVLLEVAKQATDDLVKTKALPTFWPRGLTEQEEHYPFDISVESFYLNNPAWDKDTPHYAQFRIMSDRHKLDNVVWPRFSKVNFNIDWGLSHEVFEILEETL
jgi:hypothetical protein